MDIRSSHETTPHQRPDGARTQYFRFGNLEVHHNTLPSGAFQGWHFHRYVDEVFYVTHGEIIMHWLAQGQHMRKRLLPGDVAHSGRTTHTLSNESGRPAEFVVVKAMLPSQDHSSLLRSDRVAVEVNIPYEE